MEHFKVRDLLEPTYTKVKDILPGKCGYNLIVKVVSKTVLIDIVRLDKTRVVIADFVIGDETGVVKMRLRNENFVDIIKEKQTIIIRNCKVPIVNQHMRMQVDAFGKIENCYDHIINEVNMEKDLSSVVYDNYSDRKRFNNNTNSNYQGNNRGFRDNSNYQGNNRGFRDNNYQDNRGFRNNNYQDNRGFRDDSNYQDNNRGFRDDRTQNHSYSDVASINTFLSSQIAK